MPSLKKSLVKSLKNAERIAVVGVGSCLRADDACGSIIAKKLKEAFSKKKKQGRLKFFLADQAPENITGEIKKFRPSHLIIIDSADFGKKPGAVCLIDPKDIAGVSFSTHRLPITVFADYLIASFPCEICIVGIQPKSLEVYGALSKEAQGAIKSLFEELSRILAGFLRSKNGLTLH